MPRPTESVVPATQAGQSTTAHARPTVPELPELGNATPDLLPPVRRVPPASPLPPEERNPARGSPGWADHEHHRVGRPGPVALSSVSAPGQPSTPVSPPAVALVRPPDPRLDRWHRCPREPPASASRMQLQSRSPGHRAADADRVTTTADRRRHAEAPVSRMRQAHCRQLVSHLPSATHSGTGPATWHHHTTRTRRGAQTPTSAAHRPGRHAHPLPPMRTLDHQGQPHHG